MDSIERYLEVFEGLRRRKRWNTGVDILRFAALTLAAMIACMAACTVVVTSS